ncbi:hypothetical protein C4568_00090 [Candidatus Parcubacteria bacterium]|nr:MAG: hypothetical protein C4568_00090 [Candidatus Parcubacteria bacterium]
MSKQGLVPEPGAPEISERPKGAAPEAMPLANRYRQRLGLDDRPSRPCIEPPLRYKNQPPQ